MRGMKALLAAVIIMGIAIVLGTGVLIATVVHRAMHPASQAPAISAQGMRGQGVAPATLTLGEPSGTRIVSVMRQSDTAIAVAMSGGGIPDRLVIWDLSTGRITATLKLSL